MAVVSREHLISAVARESNRHVLSSERRKDGGWNLRRIRKRLVINRRESGNDRNSLGFGCYQLSMIGAQVPRDRRCMVSFVQGAIRKADGECLYRARARGLHECNHGAGVDAA